MSVVVRFAPSPTGMLHVGNARTALVNWLYARKHQGKFILRMDDTDPERTKAEFETGIRKDLKWLGLSHDHEFRQMDRLDFYNAAIEKLKSIGRVYPCYETTEELTFKRKSQISRGLPPIYDRASLKLTADKIQQYEKEGRRPHWRFQLENKIVSWNDLARGHVEFHGDKLSDPVLLREDDRPIYTLSSVVDDIESGITHIIRGEDHVTNTAIQIQLIEALGTDASHFTFAHIPLLMDETGEKLSKRLGSMSLESFQDAGIEPMAVCSVLAKLGTSSAIHPCKTLDELASEFSLNSFSRSSPKFSMQELETVNEKLVHQFDFKDIKDRLSNYPLATEAFWNFARENMKKFTDIEDWYQICFGNIEPLILSEDQEFIRTAAEILNSLEWSENTWDHLIEALKTKTDRKGKDLFMPLRRALSRHDHGPVLKDLFNQIGREKILERIKI